MNNQYTLMNFTEDININDPFTISVHGNKGEHIVPSSLVKYFETTYPNICISKNMTEDEWVTFFANKFFEIEQKYQKLKQKTIGLDITDYPFSSIYETLKSFYALYLSSQSLYSLNINYNILQDISCNHLQERLYTFMYYFEEYENKVQNALNGKTK